MRALAHMRDPIWLGRSPLAIRLFGDADDRDRGPRLQAWLADAIAATERMRRGDLVARALRASFETTRSIDEAATVAHMSISTLKRYRRRGIEQIAALARIARDAARA